MFLDPAGSDLRRRRRGSAFVLGFPHGVYPPADSIARTAARSANGGPRLTLGPALHAMSNPGAMAQPSLASDGASGDELLRLLYEELRGLAARKMACEPSDHTLQATALVHEAYLRLAQSGGGRWQCRGHSTPPPLKPCGVFSSNAPAARKA